VLRSHGGGQRFAFDWSLAVVTANLAHREPEHSYGLSGDQLTPAVPWSASPCALGNWKVSKTGSFGLVDRDRGHVRLPRIGVVRTHESTRTLARHVERGTARIRSATVTRRGERWFCSLSVEIDRQAPAPTPPASVAGVDLGITSLAVLSTGEVIANPRHLGMAQRELRRQAARRVGPDRRTRQRPSRRWHRTRARITKLHTAVANARRDGLHKLSTRLASTYGAIVNAARTLAQLVDEGGRSSPSCGATRNEPAGNPRQPRTARAASTATGRPGPRLGQRRHRKVTTTRTEPTHVRSHFG